jgi:opacity protein-like surface antigen
MEIKKYTLALALLSSVAKGEMVDDQCYKFYVGGDLGLGVFFHNHCNDGLYNDAFVNDFDDASANFGGGRAVFIGGGRVGAAWNGSECWYAAIEGNIHSASGRTCVTGISCFNLSDDCEQYRYCYETKSSWIAGIHGHLGYKIADETVFYAIGGAKYLRGYFSQNFVFSDDDFYFPKGEFAGCRDINRWGWAFGFGYVSNLWCNWDLRLEAIYARFGRTGCPNNIVFKDVDDVDYTIANTITTTPKLFYGVVSLAYNF